MEPQRPIGQVEAQKDVEELIDRIGPDRAQQLIFEAIDRYAASSRDESWRRRRNKLLHVASVLEGNLDYDLQQILGPHF
jgi:hypothetical protein